ncbi:CHAT domain-containing protein [Fibrella aquatilis]|uniref:CHAT domain-containing protein n=1 Tax=Fibrella aquatilis TaxID=2817059 RepID=UPI00286DDA9C|nr:CHAT domain-containing protein [Fibrella aquatilis]
MQKALKPAEATIDYAHFRFHDGYKLTDSVLYIALVLRPGWLAPKLVPLTHEKALASLLKDGPSLLTTSQLGLLRARTQTVTNTGQLAQGEALYRTIWQPLDSLLKGVKQVWVSPSGLLHKVAFAALPLSGKVPGFLADRYSVRVVGSTRIVATSASRTAKSPRTALLIGGAYYGVDSAKPAAEAWPALPGTQQEVNTIAALWGASATVVTGQRATKTQLQQALATTSPDVLHLATHSFFRALTEQRTDFIRPASDPVLLRSGVVMARANVPGTDSLNPDNGILSGLELANLNLTNTELVVLSGCETGLGDIRGSEGVFGLQRAVKMAGAKNLLMSLWPVPDEPTSQFMIAFYRNWKIPNTTLAQAFANTQRAFRQRYPPAVWAAFVLVE